MNIKDVKAIHKDVSFIKNRDSIPEYVELPCLEACLMLYDKNIATTSSSANGESLHLIERAVIVVVYDMLSPENKQIAEELRKTGDLVGEKGTSGRFDDDCMLVVPINENSTSEEISQKFVDICSRFVEQDLMYGFQPKQQFVESWEKYGVTFEDEADIIDTIKGLGLAYDPNEDMVWDSEELLEKHRKFIDKKSNVEVVDFNSKILFDFHEPTPEEIEQRKKERAIELEKKGFLPENEGYSETMTSPQEDVEKNPTRYIIQECLPACLELWKKNIYTFMVSDHLNEGVCWIEVIEDSLSEENKNIYLELSEDEAVKFSYHQGTINFGVNCVGKEGQAKLLELAQRFKMQDVPRDQAYISLQEFLMSYCGCYEEYPNPNYKHMSAPWETRMNMDEMLSYMDKYEQWQNSQESHQTLRKFAPEKATKSVLEYATEHGMIVEDNRVYLSPFHYNKHKNYVNYVNELELQSIKKH